MMKKTLPNSRILALGLAGALSLATAADAALTLTINTWTQTFTWSGTVTTADFTIGANESENYRLGSIGQAGGGGSPQGAGSLGMSVTGSEKFEALNPGRVSVGDIGGTSVYTHLGETHFSGLFPPETMSLTLTGNGTAYSYWWDGISQEELDFYTTLDGTQLYLQRWAFETGSDYLNVGPALGQVVLIPEPSSALLLLGGAGMMLRRRRRA